MTAVDERPGSDLTTANAEDLNAAIEQALAHAGCTMDALRDQATSGHFESLSARLAWVAIGDLLRG